MALPSQSKVYFFFDGVSFQLSNRRILKKFIESIFRKESSPFKSLNIVFCSDQGLLRINQEHLKHDYFTDIITFPISAPGSPVDAELYISADRVRDNSQKLNTSFKSEMHRVIFHGVLHLCGYGDKTSKEKAEIRKKEDQYLDDYAKFVSQKTVSGWNSVAWNPIFVQILQNAQKKVDSQVWRRDYPWTSSFQREA